MAHRKAAQERFNWQTAEILDWMIHNLIFLKERKKGISFHINIWKETWSKRFPFCRYLRSFLLIKYKNKQSALHASKMSTCWTTQKLNTLGDFPSSVLGLQRTKFQNQREIAVGKVSHSHIKDQLEKKSSCFSLQYEAKGPFSYKVMPAPTSSEKSKTNSQEKGFCLGSIFYGKVSKATHKDIPLENQESKSPLCTGDLLPFPRHALFYIQNGQKKFTKLKRVF